MSATCAASWGPRPTGPSGSRACAASAISTRSTIAPRRTNADASSPRQDLPLVLARRPDRQRDAGVADRVEPFPRRRRPCLGGKIHAAPRHVGAAGVADSAPRRTGGARTVRRLVRNGSGRHELHLRRRRSRGARPPTPAAPVQQLLESMADWPPGTAASRSPRTHHRGAGHRRSRRLSTSSSSTGRVRRCSIARCSSSCRRTFTRSARVAASTGRIARGLCRRRVVLLRAGASHRAADRSPADGGAQHRQPAAPDASGRQRPRAEGRARRSRPGLRSHGRTHRVPRDGAATSARRRVARAAVAARAVERRARPRPPAQRSADARSTSIASKRRPSG